MCSCTGRFVLEGSKIAASAFLHFIEIGNRGKCLLCPLQLSPLPIFMILSWFLFASTSSN